VIPKGELPLKRQARLIRDVRRSFFDPGEVIINVGERADALYFILGPPDAVAMVVRQGPDGQEHELNWVAAGMYFGEKGLVYSATQRQSAGVRALTSMSCAVVDAEAFN
ncbi:unnamed protein product, partial [Discosporangium mesarthrocarpum]